MYTFIQIINNFYYIYFYLKSHMSDFCFSYHGNSKTDFHFQDFTLKRFYQLVKIIFKIIDI